MIPRISVASYVFLLLSSMPMVSIAHGDISPACLAETHALEDSATIAAATRQLQLSAVTQLQECVEQNATDCPVDVSAEAENVASACEIDGGQVYRPTVEWSCDNSNANTVTTLQVNFAACLGSNCSTDEVTHDWEDHLDNVTATVNQFLDGSGIQCSTSVSGAAKDWLRGFIVATATVAASAIIMAV